MTFNCEDLAAPNVKTRLERYRWEIARNAHIERVANVIEVMHPHVVNLLEVTTKEAVDAVVKILHEKGLKDYQAYHVENSDTFTGFDVCFISRIKPDEVEGKSITHFSSKDSHPYKNSFYTKDESGTVRQKEGSISRHAIYYFTVGKQKLGFLGLHLKAIPDDKAANDQRMNEMGVAQKIIREEIVKRGYKPVVLGDLNDYDPDVPDRDEERSTQTTVLKGLKDFDPSKAGDELVNAAVKMPRQADRYTNLWDRNENGIADPGDVTTMIDHILLPKEWEANIQRAFIFHCTSPDTSDHWPVVVDLKFSE